MSQAEEETESPRGTEIVTRLAGIVTRIEHSRPPVRDRSSRARQNAGNAGSVERFDGDREVCDDYSINPKLEAAWPYLASMKYQSQKTTSSAFKAMDIGAVACSIAAHYVDYKYDTYTDIWHFDYSATILKFLLAKRIVDCTATTILEDTPAFEAKLAEAVANSRMKDDLPRKVSEYLQAIKDRES